MSFIITIENPENFINPGFAQAFWRDSAQRTVDTAGAQRILARIAANIRNVNPEFYSIPARLTPIEAPMPNQQNAKPALLTAEEAAERLGIKVRSLNMYRMQKRGPKLRIKRFGRDVMYRADDVQAEVDRRAGRVANDTLLTAAQAAARLGVTEYALRMKRHRGQHDLPWQRIGRRVWYSAAAVEAYRARHAAGTDDVQGGGA